MWLQLPGKEFLAIDLKGAIIRTSPVQTESPKDELKLELLSEPTDGCWVHFILAGGMCRIHFSHRNRLDAFVSALSQALSADEKWMDGRSYDADAKVEVSVTLGSLVGGPTSRSQTSKPQQHTSKKADSESHASDSGGFSSHNTSGGSFGNQDHGSSGFSSHFDYGSQGDDDSD